DRRCSEDGGSEQRIQRRVRMEDEIDAERMEEEIRVEEVRACGERMPHPPEVPKERDVVAGAAAGNRGVEMARERPGPRDGLGDEQPDGGDMPRPGPYRTRLRARHATLSGCHRRPRLMIRCRTDS